MESAPSRRSALERALERERDERLGELESSTAVALEALSRSETANAEALAEIGRLRDAVADAERRLGDASDSLRTSREEAEDLRARCDSATLMRDALAAMVETRDRELELANATVDGLRARLEGALDADRTIGTRAEPGRRRTPDRTDDSARVELLHAELRRRSEESKRLRADSAAFGAEYERRFERLRGELEVARLEIASSRESKEALRRRIAELERELADRAERESRIAEERESELAAKTRIVELYKSAREDANGKSEEPTRPAAELKRLLEEAEERNEALRAELERSTAELRGVVDEKNDRIAALERELENANRLLRTAADDDADASLDELSPSAAIASRIVRSRLSLTQAYDRLVRLSEELAVERNEKRRLSQALASIVGELEERAPLVETQRARLEEFARTNARLARQIEELSAELERTKDEAAENLKSSRHHRNESSRLKREADDLGRQVRFLLREIEVSKGERRLREEGDAPRRGPFDVSDASDAITENLVTFADADDLQAKNRKLLEIVRRLSAKNEEIDEADEKNERERIDAKADALRKRVAELTEAQERQVKMMNDLAKQRDAYKKLCEERGPISEDSDRKGTERGADFQYSEMLEARLADAKEEIRRETDERRSLVERSKSNELKLVRMHDSLLGRFNDLQSKYVKCSSARESLAEKCRLLEMNLAASEREASSLNEKIDSYALTTGRLEITLERIREELSASGGEPIRDEPPVDSPRAGRKKLTNATNLSEGETGASLELSFALKNIESMKSKMENDDGDQYEKMQSTLEEANRICSALRRTLQVERAKYCDLTSYLKEEMEQYKSKFASERDVVEKLKTELADARRELRTKSALVSDLTSRLSYYDNNAPGANPPSDPDSQTDDVRILKRQLEISRRHVEKYCNIYEKSETDLKAISEAFEEYRARAEATAESSRLNENRLRETCAELESRLSNLAEETSSMRIKMNAMSEELAKKESALNEALREAAASSDALQAVEDKYADEIVLHSGDIRALTEIRQELLDVKERFSNAERTKTELETALRENRISRENRERMLVDDNQQLKNQLRELNDQNSALLDRIHDISVKLTSKTMETSADATPSDDTLNYSMDEVELKSSEQLLKIIRYLRKERDILVTKFEFMEAENKRIKSRLESAETQLDDAKLTSTERSNSDDVLATRHSGVIRKVETLDAMSDCFMDLRKERDALLEKVREMTDRYDALSNSITVLRESNGELSAKIEMLQGENEGFKTEIDKWRSMANSLIEKDNSVGIDDFKKLQGEREALSKTLNAERETVKTLAEDVAKLKSEKANLESQNDILSKQHASLFKNLKAKLAELSALKKDFDRVNGDLTDSKNAVAEKTKEIAEITAKLTANEAALADVRNKEAQLRKVGKRYKTQYEESLKTVEEEKKKSAALITEAATTSESHLETCKVLERKNLDLEKNHEEKLNTLKAQISSCAEENRTLQKEIATLKSSNQDMEEKAKQLLKQAKAKIIILNEAKENLTAELNEAKAKLEAFEQSKDENDTRLSLLVSQYDGRAAKMEKEKTALLQEKQNEINQLNKQIESLLQKINNQTPKSSMSSNQNEKPSTEPPTANIKPMAGVSQRDSARRVSGETPLASIRPMASHAAVRTAAVLPTTAQVSTHAVIQAPHTTGSVTSDILSSSSNTHATEFMPSSSSLGPRLHSQHSRHISLPPPESTQDIDTEVGSDTSGSTANIPAIPQSLNTSQIGAQAVALVMPRMETSTTDTQTLHPHQQQASSSSSSSSNSNSTVTTSHGPMGDNNSLGNKNELHRAFKRPRVASAHPQQKTILKRPKIQGFPRMAENETDYQMPTSSQRDQEDDIGGFGDSGDEENYQVTGYGMEDEENDDDKERPSETRMTTDSNMSEDQEATGSNNEADIVDDTSQEIRSSVRDDDAARRCDDNRAGDHTTTSAASATHVQEQQIETISSGSAGGNYEDGDESTPNFYLMQKMNEGESGNATAAALVEDNNADVTQQVSTHDTAGTSSSSTNNAGAQSSEAEAGSANVSTADDESPTVSSQSTAPSFVPQIEEGREAEASSTGNNVMHRGSWRTGRGNRRGGSMSPQMHQRDQRPSPIVWNSDGNNRRGPFPQQRGLQRGGRHVIRRPPNFYKRF